MKYNTEKDLLVTAEFTKGDKPLLQYIEFEDKHNNITRLKGVIGALTLDGMRKHFACAKIDSTEECEEKVIFRIKFYKELITTNE